MNLETFKKRIEAAVLKAAELQARAASLPDQQFEIAEQAIEDLQVTLEELKVAEEELRAQNEQLAVAMEATQSERARYEELFEFAPDGYLITNADGAILNINRAGAEMFGLEKKIFIGKPLYPYVHKDDRFAFLSELERLRRSNSAGCSFEMRFSPRGKEPFYASLKIGIIHDKGGKTTGLRWIVRDVSWQKQAEEAIRALNAQLEQKVKERTTELESARLELTQIKRKKAQPQPRLELENDLLASLHLQAYERILPDLQEVPLPQGEVLYRPDDAIDYVYFPSKGLISLVSTTEGGGTIEVGMVGKDGMVGLPQFLGSGRSPFLITVQMSGGARRMRADLFMAVSARQGSMHSVMLRYAYVMLTQITQSVVCNRFHSIDERFCRWLLMVQDCAGENSFALTQEFISQMLGVRRSGVTVAAGALQQKGLIKFTRGQITILDRQGLESSSCECYRIVREETQRLLGN